MPQAEAAEAANAAVEALGLRTAPTIVGEDLVLASVGLAARCRSW